LASIQFVTGTGYEFTGPEYLVLDQPSLVSGTITGFGANSGPSAGVDHIDLVGLASTSCNYAGQTLTIYDGTKAVDQLSFAGSYSTLNFQDTSDQNGGSLISFVPHPV